nr:hypothetical protein CFP56_68655 [Quercus suber]
MPTTRTAESGFAKVSNKHASCYAANDRFLDLCGLPLQSPDSGRSLIDEARYACHDLTSKGQRSFGDRGKADHCISIRIGMEIRVTDPDELKDRGQPSGKKSAMARDGRD